MVTYETPGELAHELRARRLEEARTARLARAGGRRRGRRLFSSIDSGTLVTRGPAGAVRPGIGLRIGRA